MGRATPTPGFLVLMQPTLRFRPGTVLSDVLSRERVKSSIWAPPHCSSVELEPLCGGKTQVPSTHGLLE